jgi:hypothetical protein
MREHENARSNVRLYSDWQRYNHHDLLQAFKFGGEVVLGISDRRLLVGGHIASSAVPRTNKKLCV